MPRNGTREAYQGVSPPVKSAAVTTATPVVVPCRGTVRLGRVVMLLHEGGLVAHGLHVFAGAVEQAHDEVARLMDR